MSAKDLLAAIISGDQEAAVATFESLMADKTSDGIDALRTEVAQTMFGEGKTPYEVGKDEKEAEDADEAADEADKKVTKDKGGDDSDSKEAETDAGEEDDSDDSEEDDSEDDADDKDSKFKKKVSEEILDELSTGTLLSYHDKAGKELKGLHKKHDDYFSKIAGTNNLKKKSTFSKRQVAVGADITKRSEGRDLAMKKYRSTFNDEV
jgi:TATA-binding protein-associated factor Taf7